MQHKIIFEPFKIKSVEPIFLSTQKERETYLKEAAYNTFLLNSDQVIIDFLTDSGTSAMSANQWASVMVGDESYAGSKSWFNMRNAVRDLTGMEYILPTHQGRAGERIIYSYLGGKGKTFISNTHFDTTRANIEVSGADAIDIPTPEAADFSSDYPFKGNIDLQKLAEIIQTKGAENIGAVILTVTNNSGGGQPVSMQNTKEAHELCQQHGILLLLDCCRVAENAYFIKHKEPGYEHKSYRQIAQEMFSLTDGAVMSAKKDGLVNMGGFLALRDKKISDACSNMLIITEGYATYGGLSGRDMEAVAIGLEEVFDPHYLEYRIKSTSYLGENLDKMGVPVVMPIGGHAVYVDAKKLYPQIPVYEYPGQALACELYLKGGVRSVEIGSVMFGKYDDEGKLIPAPMELVRLAIPRRVYTQSHIEYVIEIFEGILKNRNSVKGYKIVEEATFLRHFTARFEPV
jgi:tyrosine phenol-lyase